MRCKEYRKNNFTVIFLIIYFSLKEFKLDGIGPVDNRPSTDKFEHFVHTKKNVTCDMWHVTCGTWHMTHDMWHMTGGRRWTFTQNFKFLALMVWEWRGTEDISTNHESVN